MPLFFFHHHEPSRTTRDDVGCDFASLELAYVDAYRSMVEIGAELLKAQKDPSCHSIEIADGDGQTLMDLSFAEVFSRRRPARLAHRLDAINDKLRRFHELRHEIEDVCIAARASVATAHALLRRVRTIG